MNAPSWLVTAERILQGQTLAEKLLPCALPQQADTETRPLLEKNIPLAWPARDPAWQVGESGKLPSVAALKTDLTARGRLLHAFANHELLAIETMALALLRFPDAPLEFRQGLVKTLSDEQRHLTLYLARMQEYGVVFGTVPLSMAFWNLLLNVQSPLDFVVRMSLTLEQANLDFSLEYAESFRALGDEQTALVLEQIHADEMNHVKHGLKWFRQWKKPAQSDWGAYQELLPYPLSPRRAKGKIFSVNSREKVGFDAEYISQIKIAGGSRGRPPEVYIFNPECEIEAQLPADFQQYPQALQDKIFDLEPLLCWLAKESDTVLLRQTPPTDWLAAVHDLRGELPSFHLNPSSPLLRLRPWGWSEKIKQEWGSVLAKSPYRPTFLPEWYSKTFWRQQLHPLLPAEVTQLQSLEPSAKVLLKRDRSTSGRGHRVVTMADLRQEPLASDCQSGKVLPEPLLQKVADFSTQIEIMPGGEVKVFSPRFFLVDTRFQYQGSFLGQGPEQTWVKVLDAAAPLREQVVQQVVKQLQHAGYVGPLGIDGLLYQQEEQLKVHPAVEVNVRMTMGRVALELERLLKKNLTIKWDEHSWVWRFYSQKEIMALGYAGFAAFAADLKKCSTAPVFYTTPPTSARQVWTVLHHLSAT